MTKEETPAQTQFSFTVKKVDDRFLVEHPTVHVPWWLMIDQVGRNLE